MAHLLEHLLFKGSPKHPDIFAELQDRGAQFNGTTSCDRTNYFETFDATDENLEWALDLEADRMVNSFVRKDLDSEMTVVRNEFESGENSPTRVLFQRMLSAAYDGTATATRRSAAAATSRTCRSSGCRASTAPTTSPTTRCSSSPAASTRQRALELIAKSFGAIPKPAARARRPLHRRARAGRRARGDRAPRRRHPDPDGRVPRAGGRARGLRAAAARDQRARRRAVGPALQSARRDRASRRRSACRRCSCSDPGCADLRRDGSRGRVARQGARGDVRGDRRPRGQPDHGRRVERARKNNALSGFERR